MFLASPGARSACRVLSVASPALRRPCHSPALAVSSRPSRPRSAFERAVRAASRASSARRANGIRVRTPPRTRSCARPCGTHRLERQPLAPRTSSTTAARAGVDATASGSRRTSSPTAAAAEPIRRARSLRGRVGSSARAARRRAWGKRRGSARATGARAREAVDRLVVVADRAVRSSRCVPSQRSSSD